MSQAEMEHKDSNTTPHKCPDDKEEELSKLKAHVIEIEKLHEQQVATLEDKLKQTEKELRAEILKCKTEKTKFHNLDEKEEELSKLKDLAKEVEDQVAEL